MTAERLALLSIILVAAALRMANLGEAPPGLYYDEAANGVDALYVLGGERPLFFTGNQGREPWQIYLTAAATAIVGPGWLAIRLPSVVAGVIAVPAGFLLGREVGGRAVGLGAALLISVSYWHVHVSRLGFRAVWIPLVVALTLALVLRSYRTRRLADAGLAGLVLGLGLYTYIASRFLPIVVVAIAATAWLRLRPQPGVLLLSTPLAVAAVVSAPLTAYLARHPELFWARVEAASGSAVGGIERLTAAIGIFVWAGDVQARHNLPERPMFDWLAGGFFVLGTVLLARRGATSSTARSAIYLPTAFMLLPQALSSGEPHFLRAVGVIPTACVAAAMGLVAFLRALRSPSARAGLAAAIAIVWVGAVARDYFAIWAVSREAHTSLESYGRDAARLLCQLDAPEAISADSRVYREQGTFYLGSACPPGATFDAGHAVAVLAPGSPVLLTANLAMPAELVSRLGPAYVTAGRWRDERGDASVALYRPEPSALMPRRDIKATVGDVARLEGYGLRSPIRPGQEQLFELGWQVVGSTEPGVYQFAHVVRDGVERDVVWASEDVVAYPSSQWRGGAQVLTWFRLAIPHDAPEGAYWIVTGMYRTPSLQRLSVADAINRPVGDSVRLGPFKVWRGEHAVPRPVAPIAAFEEGILLADVVVPASARPGEAVDVRLRWWAAGATRNPMTVFVHLLDPAQQERAGADGPPAGGLNPTTLWEAGELVEETRRLHLPIDATPGQYQVEVGLYDPTTGARARLLEAPGRLGDGALVAWTNVRER